VAVSEPPVVLGGRWEVIGELGRGGEGAVFRVRNLRDGRHAAAKVGPVGTTDVELSRLLGLVNENVNPYRDDGVLEPAEGRRLELVVPVDIDELFWIVSDIADGSLKGDLGVVDDGDEATTTLSVAGSTALLEALASGLAFLHERGIVHGDVKPANVLRFGTEAPVWRLTDFGISALLGGATSAEPRGLSPGWTAPEVWQTGAVRRSADVYSAGQTVHMAVAGRRTTEGRAAESLPEPLRSWITAMIAADPTARPTAAELAAAVRAGRPRSDEAGPAPGDETVTTGAGPPPPPGRPPAAADDGDGQRSTRFWVIAGSIAGIVAAVAGVMALVVPGPDDPGPDPSTTTTGPTTVSPPPIDEGDDISDSTDPSTPDPTTTSSTTDGDRAVVAYTSRAAGPTQAYLLRVESGERTEVWGDRSESDPSVTADGAAVAAIVDDEDGAPVIAVGAPDAEPRTFRVEGTPSDTAIAPDGSKVAYVTDVGGDDDVVVLDVASGDVEGVAGGTSDETDPSWSGDGRRLVYVRSGSSSDVLVVVPRVEGGGGATIEVGGPARSPALTATGDGVVYIGTVAGNREVLSRSVAGDGEPDDVSQSPEEESEVVTLADGRLVTSAPNRGLHLLDPAGGDPPEALTDVSGDAL